ncbi:MAG: hypothetical protein MJE66_14990 [Proteobacteria bacterium]|nr:hypothetical protein [Pseudomonadota bacterium]
MIEPRRRRFAGFAAAAVAWAVAGAALAESEPAPRVVGLAFADFDGVGARVTEALSEGGALEVRALPAVASAPEAAAVRAWAADLGAEHVVLGLAAGGAEAPELAVDVRSGHSGATVATKRWPANGATASGVAAWIRESLGLEPVGAAPPPVSSQPDTEEPFGLGNLRSDQPVAIQSNELEVVTSNEERHLRFRDNVRVTQGDLTLTTQQLEAFYPKGQSQPERLVARGAVRVRQGERRARCDEATYQRSQDLVVCRGHAHLFERCDEVRGDEIRFDLARERVHVVGAASVVLHPEEDGSCQGGAS